MVSFIVPVYRCEDSLRRCAESILGQTYGDLELILVDDGSPDDSGALCDRLAREDSRVRVIHKENGGPSSARNRGLEEARGTYVQFVDSDDYIDPDMTQRMVQRMEQEQVQLVVCGLVLTHPDGAELLRYPEIQRVSVKQMCNQIPGFVETYFPNSPCTKLYLRSHITVPFDEKIRLGEDMLFNLRYFRNIQTLSVMDFCPLHYIVDNPSSITGNIGCYRIWDTLTCYEEGRDFYLTYGTEENRKQLRQYSVTTIMHGVLGVLASNDVAAKEKKMLVRRLKEHPLAKEILADDPELTKKRRIIIRMMRLGWLTGLKGLARIYQKRT